MFVNSDFSDLLRIFNANRVKYLVIGGYAVIEYTEPLFTQDLDIGLVPKVPMRRQSSNLCENLVRRWKD
jgi:hypothetical protein